MKKNLLTTLFTLLCMTVLPLQAKNDIPLLDAAPYDTIMDGKKVALYTISNGKVAAQIINYGGFIVSLYAPDKAGKYDNLVTNYPNIKGYLRYNLGMVGPALGRFANRIGNATFTLDGQEYHVTKNNGPHMLHGGLKGFDHVVWDVKKATEKELVLTCVLPDGEDGFPGTLTTTLTYSISKEDGLRIAYKATTDKSTVVNLSNHAYFNLDGIGKGNILKHQLTIAAEQITETDRMGIPTGKLLPVENTVYDFRTPISIGDRQMDIQGFTFGQRIEVPEGKVRQYDNNFCLNHSSSTSFDQVATLYSPQSGREMTVWNDQPGLQVYTGARTAIALESQKYPDSPNHASFPSTRLNPGETYRHVCEYRFSVK